MHLYYKGRKYFCHPVTIMPRDKLAAIMEILNAFNDLRINPSEIGISFAFMSKPPNIHMVISPEQWDYIRQTTVYSVTHSSGKMQDRNPTPLQLFREAYRLWYEADWEFIYETSYKKLIADNTKFPYECCEDLKVLLVPKVFQNTMLTTFVDENA